MGDSSSELMTGRFKRRKKHSNSRSNKSKDQDLYIDDGESHSMRTFSSESNKSIKEEAESEEESAESDPKESLGDFSYMIEADNLYIDCKVAM